MLFKPGFPPDPALAFRVERDRSLLAVARARRQNTCGYAA
jgi:hypothetical protein